MQKTGRLGLSCVASEDGAWVRLDFEWQKCRVGLGCWVGVQLDMGCIELCWVEVRFDWFGLN